MLETTWWIHAAERIPITAESPETIPTTLAPAVSLEIRDTTEHFVRIRQVNVCARSFILSEQNWIDYLAIRNGPTLGKYDSFALGGADHPTYSACMGAGHRAYTSTDQSGCLTFEFFSDASVVSSGWVATFDCIPCANGPNGTDNSDCLIGSPICSDQSFSDASTGPGINSEGGNGCVLSENYSNWYKLTVSTGGTLGLNIVPNVAADDYDFALYQSILWQSGSPVRCSYASNTGNTGMNSATNLATNTVCGTPNNGSRCGGRCMRQWLGEWSQRNSRTKFLFIGKQMDSPAEVDLLSTGI